MFAGPDLLLTTFAKLHSSWRLRCQMSSSLMAASRSGQSAVEIATAARAFHVYYHKVPDEHGGYDIEHTATMYLMGPDGKFLMLIPPEASSHRIAMLIHGRLNKVADRTEQEKQ
jgi:hypothetical protein